MKAIPRVETKALASYLEQRYGQQIQSVVARVSVSNCDVVTLKRKLDRGQAKIDLTVDYQRGLVVLNYVCTFKEKHHRSVIQIREMPINNMRQLELEFRRRGFAF